MSCPCNGYIEQVSGGFKLGSACTPSLNSTRPSGGFVFGSATNVDVPTQVWDDYVAVWHLIEHGTGASGEYKDSAIHAYNATGGNGIDATTVPTQDAGLLCGYSQLCGGRQFILAPADYLGNTSVLLVRAWVKPNSTFAARSLYGRGGSSKTSNWQFQFGHDYLRRVTASVQVEVGGVPTTYICTGTTMMQIDKWYLCAALWQPGKSLAVYLNSSTPDHSISIAGTTWPTTTTGQTLAGWNGTQYLIGNVEDVWTSTDPYRINDIGPDATAWCGGDYTVSPTQSPELT